MEHRTPNLRIGIAGSVIVGLCCLTPLLVVLLTTVGLSAWLGWLDYVLLPALVFFVALTAFALWERRKKGPTS